MSESIFIDVTVSPNVVYCSVCGVRKTLRAAIMPYSEWLGVMGSFERDHEACGGVNDGS